MDIWQAFGLVNLVISILVLFVLSWIASRLTATLDRVNGLIAGQGNDGKPMSWKQAIGWGLQLMMPGIARAAEPIIKNRLVEFLKGSAQSVIAPQSPVVPPGTTIIDQETPP